MSDVRARFAPSPTGYLHLGGARTALFCRAWARRNKGEFLLRIEDTDAARSREEFVAPILSALEWLGLKWDGEPVFQSARREFYLRAAANLLESGAAYRCYCGPEELAKMRAEQTARGENPRYDRRWRDAQTPPPRDIPPAIRFKTPLDGATRFHDHVKGEMSVENAELDDFVIVRADGTPTYNLACAADDGDMKITHVIRGDDHVMNAFKQILIHRALGGDPPAFAHLPMILSAALDESGAPIVSGDGVARYERMSKRNGAVDVNHYRREGFPASALLNYLARLSWSHGDEEFFPVQEFYGKFNLDAVQKSPARFDLEKLRWLSREHMREMNYKDLRRAGREMRPEDLGNESFWTDIRDADLALTLPRAHTLLELRRESEFFLHRPPGDFALLQEHLGEDNRAAFNDLRAALAVLPEWKAEAIKSAMNNSAKRAGLKFPRLGMPMRTLLTGAGESPDIALVAAALGREETLARLRACDDS